MTGAEVLTTGHELPQTEIRNECLETLLGGWSPTVGICFQRVEEVGDEIRTYGLYSK